MNYKQIGLFIVHWVDGLGTNNPWWQLVTGTFRLHTETSKLQYFSFLDSWTTKYSTERHRLHVLLLCEMPKNAVKRYLSRTFDDVSKYFFQIIIRQAQRQYAFCRVYIWINPSAVLCVCFFVSGDRYLGDGHIDRRESLYADLSPGEVFSPFCGDIFRGHQMRSQKWFLDNLDVASLACVINNWSLMRGRAIHQWILFIAPTQSSTHVW